MQIAVGKTLDVEVVERQLAQLWEESAEDQKTDESTAVLRARVANLLAFVTNKAGFDEVHQLLTELTARHPSRVLVMLGQQDVEDRDIEMWVESHCQTDKRTGAKRLCCEEIALTATGKFVSELPSAALPLVVPDLSTFLWWSDPPQVTDKVLATLLRASDRLIIDSAGFDEPRTDLLEMNGVYGAREFSGVGISDLNWARLTFWRALLADFYDVPTYQPLLKQIDKVRIEYVAAELAPESEAPQALLMAGWLASRLEWTLDAVQTSNQNTSYVFASREGQEIHLELNRVDFRNQPGKLVQVQLSCEANDNQDASFVVARSDDNLHILSEARIGADTQRGRVFPVRNRSTAQLLSREMEILCNDQIYQEAVEFAARMIEAK